MAGNVRAYVGDCTKYVLVFLLCDCIIWREVGEGAGTERSFIIMLRINKK